MKKVSSVVDNIIKNYSVEPVLLLKIGGSNYLFDKRVTSSSYDVTYNGEVYTANSDITAITLPNTTQVVDKETYSIKLSDPFLEYKPYFDQGMTNTPIEVIGLLINTTGGIISDSDGNFVDPNIIITNIKDSISIYKGKINNAAYNIDYSEYTAEITINAVSELASLDNLGVIRVNPRYQKAKNPSDTAYDYIFDDRATVSLKWGKY